MKDSFIFEGKKWISARRASKISDYASDYVGQLCRADKLECRMIGRTWFVTEESIYNHKANIIHDKIYRNKLQSLKATKSADGEVVVVEQNSNSNFVDETVSENASEDNSSALVNSNFGATTSEADNSKLVLNNAESNSNEVVGSNKISYLSDDRPLMPIVSKVEKVVTPVPSFETKIKINAVDTKTSVSVDAKKVSEGAEKVAVKNSVPVESHEMPVGSLILSRAMNMTGILFVIIGIVGGTMFAFNQVSEVLTKNSAGNQASVHGVVGAVISFLRDASHSIAGIFGHGQKLSVNYVSNTGTDSVASQNEGKSDGMAIVPSTGSVDGDEAAKQKIRDSFSDQVEVRADKSGTAGVITPVFREAKGKDFVYVMVPVNEKTPSKAAGSP